MRRSALYLLLLLGCGTTLLPFLWMISTSLKSGAEAFAIPMTFVPAAPRWGNYAEVAREIPLVRYVVNSVVVTVCVTVGTLLTTIMGLSPSPASDSGGATSSLPSASER